MKVIVLNNLNDEEFHEVIGRREIVTLSKNYLKRYYSADLFTECKRVSTAINRFFKALEKDYPAFTEFKEGIIEDVKQGTYEISLFSNDLKFAFAIEENEGCYYISVTVPMEQEEQEQEEQALETLDKNKQQILKQWKALAETDLGSKELNEQAQEFYNLFKSVLLQRRTQLNGNEYKNIITSLRAYGDTKPTKDKDIVVVELLNLNKSSIVLELGSIEPLNMFLGNILGWFKRYYAITEEKEKQEQEQEEAKRESTNMKDIKIKTSWSKILKDENGWHDIDKEYIVLDIDMEGVTWDLGCNIMYSLEDKINEDGFYSCSQGGCPDFDEEKGTFWDCLFFERDCGSVKDQRKEVIKYVNSIKKEIIKKC